jgi:hypothetical protein
VSSRSGGFCLVECGIVSIYAECLREFNDGADGLHAAFCLWCLTSRIRWVPAKRGPHLDPLVGRQRSAPYCVAQTCKKLLERPETGGKSWLCMQLSS